MVVKSWLEQTLHGLVKHPESIVIEEKTDEMGLLFTISCHKEDTGALIGKGGEHVNALRTLLRVCGHCHDVKASLKVKA